MKRCQALTILLFLLISLAGFAQSIEKYPLLPAVRSSFRGLSVVNDSIAWVSGSKGWVGRT
ncbi:MAG TPA: hypothetical protein PLJ08_17785, partial [Cyclobacteriaceae bacterium]|nr:hypothetical protein [Cyclobacteriaceae bacterium]